MTNVFASDTYVIVPAVGIGATLITLNKKIVPRTWMWVTIGLLLAYWGLQSHKQARAWETNLSVWQKSYEQEPTPINTLNYGIHLLGAGRAEDALPLAEILKTWNPSLINFPSFYAKTIYLHPHLSPTAKIEVLKKTHLTGVWPAYFLASLFAGLGDFQKAFEEMQQPLKDPASFAHDTEEDLETVTAEVTFFCIKAQQPHCDKILPTLRRELEDHSWMRSAPWDENRFKHRLTQLGYSP